MPTVNYISLGEALKNASAEGTASEAQGVLAGVICAGGCTDRQAWQDHLLGDNTSGTTVTAACDLLFELHDEILRQFNDDAFGFSLLLPADEAPLSVRTDALGQWSGGFLYGLALGGFREDVDLPDTVSEVMKDFYEISHARFAYDKTDDADEAAYMEIVEYVRMSVLLLHEELQPVPENTRLQ